jgi:2'-5' RNA ligase
LGVRMFVAVWPDAATRRRLSRLALGSDQGLRLVNPAQWHVTLRFLGEVDEALVPALIGELGEVVQNTASPLRCRMGPATAWFSGERVLQVPVAGLEGVAEQVYRATVALVPDPAPGRRPHFTGHLTLGRATRRRPDRPDRAGTAVQAARPTLAGIPIAGSFTVGAIDLVRSTLTEEGPRYTTLARLPLGRAVEPG